MNLVEYIFIPVCEKMEKLFPNCNHLYEAIVNYYLNTLMCNKIY